MGERLKGKVAMTIGAGSVGPGWSNGKATAVLFVREGAKVFAVDIILAAAEATRSRIAQEGEACTIYEGDVSNASAVKDMVEHVVCSINLAVPSHTSRVVRMMSHGYFVKCVLQPGDVHGLEPIAFIDCWQNVIGR